MSATAAAPGPATAVSVARPRAVYTLVATAGLLLLALAPILMFAVSAASGVSMGEEGGFLVIAVAIPLVAAALAWRYGTWSKVVAIVVALVAASGLFWLAFGLAYPASFGDFVPGMSFVLGFVLALGGAIAALVQGRRRNLTAVATANERRIVVGAAAILAVAMVVSGIMTFLAGRAVADADGTPVAMADFAFADGTYTVAADAPATLAVHNSDGFVHNLAVPELDVDAVTVLPGADAVVEVPAAPAGSYTIYCTLHSDTSTKDPQEAGMAATLNVE